MKKPLAALAAAFLALGVSQASAHQYKPVPQPQPHPHHSHHHHGDSGFFLGFQFGDPYWNDPFWDAPVRPVKRACTIERASEKAFRMGINHQRITKAPGFIKIVGRNHGDKVQVKFARAPGCPIIR